MKSANDNDGRGKAICATNDSKIQWLLRPLGYVDGEPPSTEGVLELGGTGIPALPAAMQKQTKAVDEAKL